jgi:hypothetical protein
MAIIAKDYRHEVPAYGRINPMALSSCSDTPERGANTQKFLQLPRIIDNPLLTEQRPMFRLGNRDETASHPDLGLFHTQRELSKTEP